MSARRSLLRLTRWLLFLALLGGAVACGGKAPAQPQAWIDSPSDGATLSSGSPVPVVCRASAPEGVAEVLLKVNGAPYRSMPVAGDAATCAVTIDWLPDGSGAYTLQVTAYDGTGAGSTPATVTVKVEGVSVEPAGTLAAEATLTPTLAAEPDTPAPTVEPDTPTPTLEPTAAPTDTPWPPAQVSFTVDPETVELGDCATLHWSVEHATAVYLDGEGVVGEGSREVCPPVGTTTYNLHVEAPGGDVDRAVTVDVAIVAHLADLTPPPVPRLESPETGASLTAAVCPVKVPLNWSPVTDPSGVVYQVRVRVKDGTMWRTIGDWETDATTYKVQLECDHEYQWGVRARDGAGNTGDWAQASLRIVSP